MCMSKYRVNFPGNRRVERYSPIVARGLLALRTRAPWSIHCSAGWGNNAITPIEQTKSGAFGAAADLVRVRCKILHI